MKTEFMFTSESVTEGHPDKLCDQISDAIVGRLLRRDPTASVIAECAIATGIVFIAARVGSTAGIDIPNTAREVILRAGYDQDGFDVRNCTVMTSLTELPPSPRGWKSEEDLDDDEIERIPVSDQVTVFGYACDHTPTFLPVPIWLAHALARRLSEVRRQEILPYLAPDAKTQVGVEFQGQRPARVHSLSMVVSQRGSRAPTIERLREELLEHVVRPTFDSESVRPDGQSRIFINPAGPVTSGGPSVHSGLTGRKTAVDTYGEFSRYCGSALSGKDPTRIDRVGPYAARYAAKNVVAAGLARECEIQLSYTIGLAGPVSVQVETFGTSRLSDSEIAARVIRHFDFRLAGIIRQFRLRQLAARDDEGFYQKLATFGHVGRSDLDLPWERTDRVDELRS